MTVPFQRRIGCPRRGADPVRQGGPRGGSLGRLLLMGSIGLLGSTAISARAQDVAQRPTVDEPVVVTAEAVHGTVAPGQSSAVVVTLKVPKYMWIGAPRGQDRSPAGTRIRMVDDPAFHFEDPVFPEPSVEGVPVRVGVTRVFQGEVSVVVPFRVRADAEPGRYELTALVTYTPAYDAGGLSTHVDRPHVAQVRVSPETRTVNGELPTPSVREVPDDFQVQPASFNPPGFVGPMMHEYGESTFTGAMHSLFMDPPGHGKSIRHVSYPFARSSNQEGVSVGGGLAFLNTTPEGVMTGTLSLLGFHNEFLGTTFGFDFITCPAAYKNLQVSARVATSDHREVTVEWEDFSWGDADRWGWQVDARAGTDPRNRFFGLGSGSNEEDVSVYDLREIGGTLDFYHLPIQKLRVGIGYKVRHVDIGEGLDISDLGFARIPDIQERFSGTVGLGGATTMGGRFNVIWDGRNQEFTPSAGFFGQFTAEYNRTVDGADSLERDFGRFFLDVRQYLSTVDRRISLVLRGQAIATTSDDIPFFEQARLGGRTTLRAFDEGRFHGRHVVYGSAELRYTMMNMTIMGFPMALVASPFLDVGQVFNSGEFGDDLNVDPGLSLRFINPPNVGYIVSLAHGQDGAYVEGGITLPF